METCKGYAVTMEDGTQIKIDAPSFGAVLMMFGEKDIKSIDKYRTEEEN
jgi:hypothetical protein